MEVEKYGLEKSVWTQDDFEIMGWHDASILAMQTIVNEERQSLDFFLDIDYIFKWIYPIPPEEEYSFWIAPCTLLFEESFDLNINIETGGDALYDLEIADIELMSTTEKNGRIIYDWEIELQQGRITLKSLGYKQIVRKQPIFTKSLYISMEQRGGVSFSCMPC